MDFKALPAGTKPSTLHNQSDLKDRFRSRRGQMAGVYLEVVRWGHDLLDK